MSNIRVGMIRCDCHALYYACIMSQHDPFVLRQPVAREHLHLPQLGWQLGLVHKFFYTTSKPDKMTVDSVDGFEVTRLWDQNRTHAELLQKILLGRPRICETLDSLLGGAHRRIAGMLAL